MKTVEQHYAKIARLYDVIWKDYIKNTNEEVIKNLELKDGFDVLDAGCGTGYLIKRLWEENPRLNIIGVDISEKMLNIAKKRLKGRKIKLLKKDMEDLNLSDKFDIIVSNGNIHYIKNIEGFIQKCKSLLKENGQLILVDWSKDYLLFRVLKIYWKFRIKPFTQIYTMEEIKDRLTKTGFKIEKSYNFKPTRFWRCYLIKAKI